MIPPWPRRAGPWAWRSRRGRSSTTCSGPRPGPGTAPRGPALLGGAGLARLAVGRGDDALDLELSGLGDLGSGRHHRLALRLAIAGRPVLGDLDDRPPTRDGFDRATARHN